MTQERTQGRVRRPKISILGTRGIPARYGGFETFAEHLSVGLAARGWGVDVYCEADGFDRPDNYKGVRLVTVPVPGLGPLKTIVFDLICLWRARRSDIVYMLGYGASTFCFLPRMWGSYVLVNMDGIEWARSKFNLAARLYLRAMEFLATKTANHLIADADGIRSHLVTTYRRLPPISVIAYGAEVVEPLPTSTLDRWGLSPGDYFLVVARLEPENHIVEIVRGYLESGVEAPLVVVGDHTVGTRYTDELNKMAQKRVRFVGAVHDAAVLSALRFHAKAYLHGHSVGGTNPSLLEAMGCGNFIVAHDNVFNREVTGGYAAFFTSVSSLAEILKKYDFTSAQATELRQKCVSRIRSHYNWSTIVDQYASLFSTIYNK